MFGESGLWMCFVLLRYTSDFVNRKNNKTTKRTYKEAFAGDGWMLIAMGTEHSRADQSGFPAPASCRYIGVTCRVEGRFLLRFALFRLLASGIATTVLRHSC